MSGYVFVMGVCYGCRHPFSFNPNLVPSLTIKNGKQVTPGTPGSAREPFCQSCITKANVVRSKNGLSPLVIHPDAYKPCPEEEIRY